MQELTPSHTVLNIFFKCSKRTHADLIVLQASISWYDFMIRISDLDELAVHPGIFGKRNYQVLYPAPESPGNISS